MTPLRSVLVHGAAGLVLVLAGCTDAETLHSQEGQYCGPPGVEPSCDSGLFCDHQDGQCGTNGQGGVCRSPCGAVSTAEFAPVCGCDGKVYDTDGAACHVSISTWSRTAKPPSQCAP
jgi:hypothetical protein